MKTSTPAEPFRSVFRHLARPTDWLMRLFLRLEFPLPRHATGGGDHHHHHPWGNCWWIPAVSVNGLNHSLAVPVPRGACLFLVAGKWKTRNSNVRTCAREKLIRNESSFVSVVVVVVVEFGWRKTAGSRALNLMGPCLHPTEYHPSKIVFIFHLCTPHQNFSSVGEMVTVYELGPGVDLAGISLHYIRNRRCLM